MYVQQIKCLQPNIDQKINSQTTLVIEITRAQSCKCRNNKNNISLSLSLHIFWYLIIFKSYNYMTAAVTSGFIATPASFHTTQAHIVICIL